jgi:hypothetical protein
MVYGLSRDLREIMNIKRVVVYANKYIGSSKIIPNLREYVVSIIKINI